MSAVTAAGEKPLRIGELAELTGTTPRTIRYYEEIGLLGGGGQRTQGQHRSYTRADVERVREIVRLRDLLGLTLEQLSELVDAETARAGIRRELAQSDDPDRRRGLLEEALGHIGTQLRLVRARRAELEQLERELVAKQRAVRRKLA